VFHVTLDGALLGERPPDFKEGDPALQATDDRPPWFVRRFEQLSRVWQWIVLGLAAAALLYGLSLWMEPDEPLPGDLEERAVLAGKALGKGEWKTLKRLAKPGTAKKLDQWYQKVRPKAWEDVTGDATVDVKVGDIRKLLKKYEGSTAVVDALADLEIGIAGKPEIRVSLVWCEDKFAEWWLDGEATLESARGTKSKNEKPGQQQTQPQLSEKPANPYAD